MICKMENRYNIATKNVCLGLSPKSWNSQWSDFDVGDDEESKDGDIEHLNEWW